MSSMVAILFMLAFLGLAGCVGGLLCLLFWAVAPEGDDLGGEP